MNRGFRRSRPRDLALELGLEKGNDVLERLVEQHPEHAPPDHVLRALQTQTPEARLRALSRRGASRRIVRSAKFHGDENVIGTTRASRRAMELASVKICTTIALTSLLGVFASCTAQSSGESGPKSAADAMSGDVDAGSDDGTVTIDTDAADGPSTTFGQPCKVGHDATCGAGFICLPGPTGGSAGFCTKTCPKTSSAACSDTPPGTAAYCVVTDVDPAGDKGCAFVCKAKGLTFACPGALHCEPNEDPPGSGQYLCLP